MFIQTEDTPNPNSMKFLPGRDVQPGGTTQFDTSNQADASPLASALFETDGVQAVFFGQDFVTITKAADVDWAHIKPALLGAIMDFFVSGAPLFTEGWSQSLSADGGDETEYTGEAADIVKEIKELIATRVRPAVAADGGDIIFHKFEPDSGRVFLTMHGACAGCPSSTMTLKAGIENLLKHYVPEVSSVEAVS